MTHTC